MLSLRSFFAPFSHPIGRVARVYASKRSLLALLLVPLLLVTSCGDNPGQAEDAPPSGRILLWHDWRADEAAFLDEQLTRFEELYPSITVIRVSMGQEEYVERFAERTTSGLGPDVVLADADVLVELTRRGLLFNLNQLVTASGASSGTPEAEESGDVVIVESSISRVDDYLPQVLAAVTLTSTTAVAGDSAVAPRYAVPYSLHTKLLYYRRDRMAEPPQTLKELIDDVQQGHPATLPISLSDSFWGVRAFGGSWLNAQGELAINGGALVNWIDYISELQGISGFYLDTDIARLRNRFIDGEADLHIDSSRQYGPLSAALGEALGVVVLPEGSTQHPPGPWLHVDGLAISRATSPDEVRAAALLIDYLTNTQQQARFAVAGTGRLPAHRSLLYSRNLPLISYQLARQVRTAVAVPANDLAVWQLLTKPGGIGVEAFAEAVAGTRTAGDAVRIITNFLASTSGRAVAVTDIERCPSWLNETNGYELTLWHSLEDRRADTLATVAQNFAAVCPGATIVLEFHDYSTIEGDFRSAVAASHGPTMLLESTRLTAQLASDELLMDLNRLVEPSSLQRFIPEAQEAMRYQDGLYGIPESVEVLALYYNTELADVPLVTLEDVDFSISPDRPLALPVDFFYGYWGMAAFGEFRFEAGRGVVTKSDGLSRWLTWLEDMQNQPGVFVGDYAEAKALFLSGNAAYFVSGPWALESVRGALGSGSVRVTKLPAGTYGPGLPVLQVQGVMVNHSVSLREAELAVAFANYLSSPSTQLLFAQTGSHVSALVNIDLSDYPLLAGFREQAKWAVNVSETPEFVRMQDLGDKLYTQVLSGDVEPRDGVAAFTDAVRAANVGDEEEPEAADSAADEASGDQPLDDTASGDTVSDGGADDEPAQESTTP